MAPRSATFLTYGNDEQCIETQKFIEDAGVLLKVRDISKQPLTQHELRELVGFLDLGHFLNNLSAAYAKHKLDQKPLDRAKVIELMVEDHTLIRRPIIQCARLTTVGCDKKKITEMLQIGANGSDPNNVSRSRPRGRNEREGRRESAPAGK